MSVFGIGPSELVLILVLALIFIGPNKMPEVALSLGKALREFQKASAELTDALNAEVEAAQIRKSAEQNGIVQASDISEAEVVAAPIPEPVAETETPTLDSITIVPVAEPVVDTASEPVAAPSQITAPLPDPTGMAALPAALVEPSDSMRSVAIVAAIAEPVPVGASINPPRPDPAGIAPLPLALLQPSDSVRASEASSVPVKPESDSEQETVSSAAVEIEPAVTESTEAQPSTVLVEA